MLFWLLACEGEKAEAPPEPASIPIADPLPAERWVVSVEGSVDTLARLALERQLTSCPGRPGAWVAQLDPQGGLARLGPVAGGSADPATTACLEAGLKANKLPGAALVELRWKDPAVEDYERRVGELLALAVGQRPDGRCAGLRFRVDAEGGLIDPQLTSPSGEAALDAAVLAAAKATTLPKIPKNLLSFYGESFLVCAGGMARPG